MGETIYAVQILQRQVATLAPVLVVVTEIHAQDLVAVPDAVVGVLDAVAAVADGARSLD